MLKQSEKLLTLIGNILVILSTIGIVIILLVMLVYPIIQSEIDEVNWFLLSISILSYFITVGFAFMFKVLCKISKKLNADEIEEKGIKIF